MTEIRMLWLETGDLYTIRRGVEAGVQRGYYVDHLEVLDLRFEATGGGSCVTGPGGNLLNLYDALIIRSFMPWLAESLTLAKLFASAGKVVCDHALVDEGYAMSKMHDYVVLAASSVDVPNTFHCFDAWQAEAASEVLGFPCILKGIHGSEGRHVHRIDTREQFRKRLGQYRGGELMVQEYLDARSDYRVICVGFKSLPLVVERTPRQGEFRTNFEYQEIVTALPAAEVPEIVALAERAASVLRREFTAVDIRCRGMKPLILEANRRPGFKGFEEATHYDVAGQLIDYVADRVRQNKGGLS